VGLSESLAAVWAARARVATTVGVERAILRLFGVSGLDREDRPLAGSVVDGYVRSDPARLAGGVALPFAMALLEYDVAPRRLAVDVAAGAVDLRLEAELLREPERRAQAEAEVARLMAAALERIDANRTARRELLDLLGDPPRPWLGASVEEPSAGDARDEAVAFVRAGADLVRIAVPPGRELADRLSDVGIELARWQSREGRTGPAAEESPELAPAGSQRGLRILRRALDEVAAERRSYVRLATVAPGLSAPEQAVVAAFERVDVVALDPLGEIVSTGVDPDRALADHAFAHRLIERSGGLALLGAGPLVVAPDLAAGRPSDPSTRAGRALALQLVGAALARAGGLAPDRVLVGGLPAWSAGERDGGAVALAAVALRRAALPEHPFAFEEPAGDEAGARWAAIVGAVLPVTPGAAILLRAGGTAGFGPAARATRAAAAAADEMAGSVGPLSLRGPALDHARAVVKSGVETLERLRDEGWPSIVGEAIEASGRPLGRGSVAERADGLDPLALEASAG
jgi:beta-lysine 5,6-aminomutase alpha subunit